MDRFSRIKLFLGEIAFYKLAKSHILICGLGAVGGYALEGLARSGAGELSIVDCDRINITNINRQILACESTLGEYKAFAARKRVLDINPECKVNAFVEFVHTDTLPKLLELNPDLIIDAIDSLLPKTELICAAVNRKIPIISCLGAAMRSDESQVKTGFLSEVRGCPLGRDLKNRLRRRGVSLDSVLCVYSTESLPSPLPIIKPDGRKKDESEFSRGRERNVMGSLPTLTGIFGLTAANLAIKLLTSGKHLQE